MRKWAIVLHFYQPPVQDLGITKQVLQSCYLPLLKLIKSKPEIRLTINLNGGLVEQLVKMQQDEFFSLVKEVVSNGQVELLNSPIYHPIIPLVPPELVERQVEKQRWVTKEAAGVEIDRGLFPPELAVNERIIKWAGSKFDYILVDETAIGLGLEYGSVKRWGGAKLVVNCRRVADVIRSYPKRIGGRQIGNELRKWVGENQSAVTVNDAEVFGHHYEERREVLEDLWTEREFEFVQTKEIAQEAGKLVQSVRDSSWQVWLGDDSGESLRLWSDNKNGLQAKYQELMQTAVKTMEKWKGQTEPAQVTEAKEYLDKGFSSCYLYWLSNWPWWHPDLVQKGADQLIRSIRSLAAPKEVKQAAEIMYHDFLKDLWLYHWSGKVQDKYREFDEKLKRQKATDATI